MNNSKNAGQLDFQTEKATRGVLECFLRKLQARRTDLILLKRNSSTGVFL